MPLCPKCGKVAPEGATFCPSCGYNLAVAPMPQPHPITPSASTKKSAGGGGSREIEQIFAKFNESWMTYWDAYVELQNQLYESVKAARDVSWLAATDTQKISEINSVQRDLFASMPRRMDYMPVGQIAQDLDSALSKLQELEKALSVELEKCTRLEEATEVLKERARETKEELLRAMQ